MTVILCCPQTYQKSVLDRQWIIHGRILHAYCSVWHITINISGAQLANIYFLSRQQHESSLDKVCRDCSQELGTVLTKEISPGSNLSLLKITVLKSWAEGKKKRKSENNWILSISDSGSEWSISVMRSFLPSTANLYNIVLQH